MLVLICPGLLLAQHTKPALADKLAPTLRTAARQSTATLSSVRVSVRERAAFETWVREALPGVQLHAEAGNSGLLLVSGLTSAQLDLLVTSPLVLFVDAPNRPAHDERQLNRADPTVNNVSAVHQLYPSLTGQALTVSVKENLFDPTDIDFKGRVVEVASSTAPRSEHATIMATLIAGGGNSAPSGKGAAWQARLAPSDYANLLPDDDAQLASRGVSVQNHSYGTGIENYYGLEAQAYDAQSRRNPALLHVFSSGNSGSQTSTTGAYQGLAAVANLTGQFKMSKNTVSVGATNALGQVAALSSRGPAHDGRVKPELVAFGDDGSSDAAALVSGISLLAQQAYRDQNNGVLPPAALVKAALLNSADDTGRPEVDFGTGFGQADALGTVRTLLAGHYRTGSVSQGQVQRFLLAAPPGTQRLKVTLTWTDPEAAANARQALVNDLDLEVVDATSVPTRWLPWTLSAFPHPDSLALPARRRPDHLNNVEQITLPVSASGSYALFVRGFNVPVGPQAFSVAYEFESGLEWLHPLETRSLRPGTTEQLRWQWASPAITARLDYQLIGTNTWQLIDARVDLAQRSYAWSVPDATAPAQLRLTTATGTTYLSDTFAIARALPLRVGYACPDETLLYWGRVPGATRYQVYQLGATQLEPFLLTTDTAFVLSKAQQEVSPYYAVEPVLGALRGERGTTLDVANTGLNCYLRSFVPRLAVADTVQLLLELGSTFRLQSVRLQRRDQGEFRTIQDLRLPFGLATQFTDLEAAPGLNEYRILLQDVNGRAFYSEVESVYQVRRNDLLVFPVPVAAGAPLTVIGEPGLPLHLRLYDSLGRLLREITAEGTINTLDTSGLRSGVYLLRARVAGTDITRRIVLL